MQGEPIVCPWSHEDEIRRLADALAEAQSELRKAREATSYWKEWQTALGAVDDLDADRVRLFARALSAETKLEHTKKIIDVEKARADGWKLRWEKAQEQVIRWFQAAKEQNP